MISLDFLTPLGSLFSYYSTDSLISAICVSAISLLLLQLACLPVFIESSLSFIICLFMLINFAERKILIENIYIYIYISIYIYIHMYMYICNFSWKAFEAFSFTSVLL